MAEDDNLYSANDTEGAAGYVLAVHILIQRYSKLTETEEEVPYSVQKESVIYELPFETKNI